MSKFEMLKNSKEIITIYRTKKMLMKKAELMRIVSEWNLSSRKEF